MLGVRLSLAPAPKEAQIGHRYIALPVEVQIILEKTAVRMSSAQDVEQGLMPQKCAMYPQKQVRATPYAFIVVASTTHQIGVAIDLRTTERNQGQHLRTSGNTEQVTFTKDLGNLR